MLVSRGLAMVVLVLLLAASAVAAQDGFRITYDVDQSRPGRARLNGRVTNDRGQDVFDVNITAEALDARGKVVARGISFVDSRIGSGDTRSFAVSVPAVDGVTGYRVVVSSFRTGFAQGP